MATTAGLTRTTAPTTGGIAHRRAGRRPVGRRRARHRRHHAARRSPPRSPGPASLVAWAALVLLSRPARVARSPRWARATPTAVASRPTCDAPSVPGPPRPSGWCFYFAMPVGAPPASMMAGGYVADVVGGGRTTAVIVAGSLIVGSR